VGRGGRGLSLGLGWSLQIISSAECHWGKGVGLIWPWVDVYLYPTELNEMKRFGWVARFWR